MKRYLSLLLLAAAISTVQAIVPKVDFQPSYSELGNIERTDSATRVALTLMHLPGYWVKISAEPYIVDVNDSTRIFKIIGQENIPLNKKITMPKSGRHEGALLFEPLPADIELVDIILDEPSSASDNILGVHLNEQKTARPAYHHAADLFGDSAGAWDISLPERYRDYPIYSREGRAHLHGKIDNYSPRIGFSTFTVDTRDFLTNEEYVNIGEIEPDGTFSVDLVVHHPQTGYFRIGDMARNLFYMPGDTLEIVASNRLGNGTAGRRNPEYFGFVGKLSDAAKINMLTDSVKTRHDLVNKVWDKYRVMPSDSMAVPVIEANRELCMLLDTVLTDMPHFLEKADVSLRCKDFVAVGAASFIVDQLEDNELRLRYVDSENNKVDPAVLMEPRRKYIDFIYNNPLMGACSFSMPNRWMFSKMVYPSLAYVNKGESDSIRACDKANESVYGVGNCFTAQLSRAAFFCDMLQQTPTVTRDNIEALRGKVAALASTLTYPKLVDVVLQAYSTAVEDMVFSEVQESESAELSRQQPADRTALDKLIAPYSGNVLFVDFWGLSCGACRQTMKDSKDMLARYEDKPFKALYVTEDDGSKERSLKWLEKEGINGEFIFVDSDTWNRLRASLGFLGVPFGLLIDKAGNIVKTNVYHLHEGEIDSLL